MTAVNQPTSKSANDYVGYEYLTVATAPARSAMLADGYRAFGWELQDASSRTLQFRRPRAIDNKTALVRLQRRFEAQSAQIADLDAAPVRNGRIAGLSLGLVGCAFLAGATFAYLAAMIALMIVLAIPGFACWIAAYPVCRAIAASSSRRNAQTIEHLYDLNDDVCRKASELLA
ncbi:putative membrane protein [Bifidobacterium saguini DSM 23967]|nr:putative membrane protein [Bifidobacterium saguini DSM 23967]